MKKLFHVRQSCSRKKALYFLDKKILSFPAILKKFSSRKRAIKFGVSYSVFDGEELLEASIISVRQQVDYVNVVAQLVSWHGNPADDLLVEKLRSLQEKKLVDEIIFFEPDLKKSPQFNETKKRNIGLKAAVRSGVSYFMTMDCDEFYFENEVEEAKKIIINSNITHSYCSQVIYGQMPTQQVIWNNCCHVQFFSRVDKFSVLACNEFAPCRVDPTRMILERAGSKHFVLDVVRMHHFSLVRSNLEQKYANTSFRILGEDPIKRPEISERYLANVEDYFNLQSKLKN